MSLPEAFIDVVAPRNETETSRLLLAGTNAWFVGAAFPWFFIETPTTAQTAVHAMPWVATTLGIVALRWTRMQRFRENIRLALLVGLPLGIGGAAATRGESLNETAFSDVSVLICVLSLWVFGATLVARPAPRTLAEPGQPPPRRWPRRLQETWPTLATIAAALLTVSFAPRWVDPAARELAWGDAAVAGSLLTTAAAVALGVGVILLGSTADAPEPKIHGSIWQRVVPPLLVAAFGTAVYALTLVRP